MIVNADASSQPLFPASAGPVLLWNLHLTASVYFGPSKSLSVDSDTIPPLGAVTVDGSAVMFGSSLSASVIIPVQATLTGVSAMVSPAQIQAQLGALGLMKDQTGQTMLGSGVPPGVPNVASASQIFGAPAGSPYVLHTMAANGRIWAVSLSYAIASDASYPAGKASAAAQIKMGSGTVLEIVELSLSAPGQNDSGHGDLALNGLPIASGDTVVLDVNGGTPIDATVIQRASALVLYSVP